MNIETDLSNHSLSNQFNLEEWKACREKQIQERLKYVSDVVEAGFGI